MRVLIPHSRAGMLWRFFFAAIIMIGSVAATTAVAGLLQVSTLAQYLSVNPGITSNQIKLPAPGRPQTLLLIGSDHRAGAPVRGSNTDTMLLLRLNARSSTINVMSIPRDLEVQVPGHGTQKLNAAYSLGGYGLLIRTIRALLDRHPARVSEAMRQQSVAERSAAVRALPPHRHRHRAQRAPAGLPALGQGALPAVQAAGQP